MRQHICVGTAVKQLKRGACVPLPCLYCKATLVHYKVALFTVLSAPIAGKRDENLVEPGLKFTIQANMSKGCSLWISHLDVQACEAAKYVSSEEDTCRLWRQI